MHIKFYAATVRVYNPLRGTDDSSWQLNYLVMRHFLHIELYLATVRVYNPLQKMDDTSW